MAAKDVVFDNYGVQSLQSKVTYELVISISSEQSRKMITNSQYLTFIVEPKEARVIVNGEIWPTEDGVARKFVPLDTYKYRIEADRYHVEKGVVKVDNPTRKVQQTITLKPAYGFISIPDDRDLMDASVYIDNEYIGTAPLITDTLESGPHTVKIEKALYSPFNETITVDGGQTLNISPKMTAHFARVTLIVGNNAEIWVNGECKGTGKWEGKLLMGECTIETRLANWLPTKISKNISVMDDNKTILLDSPIPIYGSLDMITLPIVSNVCVNYRNDRKGSYMFKYMFGALSPKEGLAPIGCLSNLLDEDKQILDLSSNWADVSFSCNAPDVQIYVDGQLIGLLESVVKLPYGSHTIRLIAENYIDYDSEINVTETQKSFCLTMQEQTDGYLTFTIDDVTFAMVKVRTGTFPMGNDYTYEGGTVHYVSLSTFYIGETEVTQALWTAVMGSNPSYFEGNNHPVDYVSWFDCQVFIDRLNMLTGQMFRLPTDAEWEYAALGGNQYFQYFNTVRPDLEEVAWIADNTNEQTQDVKTKLPNKLGIYDMEGNVCEWCQNWFQFYTSTEMETNPQGPKTGDNRTFRGSSAKNAWDDSLFDLSQEYCENPYVRENFLGFRLAMTYPNKKD
jgi:formylglycine-generating enzyme required for sulfatase activity